MTAEPEMTCPHAHAASPRARIRIHPERSQPDEAHAILAAGRVAHVGFVQDGQPFVIPMTYQFDAGRPGHVYLHGAHHSRLLQHLATGAPVCVTVTLVDGLVYSRTALFHSVNYRSVVCFGRAGLRSHPGRPPRSHRVHRASDRRAERQGAEWRSQGSPRCRSGGAGHGRRDPPGPLAEPLLQRRFGGDLHI